MTLPLITVDSILSWNPCEEYDRAKLASVFGEGEFSLFDVLHADLDLQDRLWAIVRIETLGNEGLEAVDAWVMEQFDLMDATTLEGENCKANWPQPSEFRRAALLSSLMFHETGSDNAFMAGLATVLEGLS